jgi:hypothetical protein
MESYLVDFGVCTNWADAFGAHEPLNQSTAQVSFSFLHLQNNSAILFGKYENNQFCAPRLSGKKYEAGFFVDNQENCFNGTMQFVSLNVMRGLRPCRRDDIISLVSRHAS